MLFDSCFNLYLFLFDNPHSNSMTVNITNEKDSKNKFIAFNVRRTEHMILGILWYSRVTFCGTYNLGIPVVLKGNLL